MDVYFVSYIRDEQKFDSIEDFLIQINKDKENIEKIKEILLNQINDIRNRKR